MKFKTSMHVGELSMALRGFEHNENTFFNRCPCQHKFPSYVPRCPPASMIPVKLFSKGFHGQIVHVHGMNETAFERISWSS